MPSVFDDLTKKQLAEALTAAQGQLLPTNRAFIEGDHWQDAEAWIGPIAIEGEDGGEEMMALLQRQFVSRNVYAEGTERHAGGTVGHEPRWAFTVRRPLPTGTELTPAEQAVIDTVTAAVTPWWDRQRAHLRLVRMVATMLWADGAAADSGGGDVIPVALPGEGRSGLRLRIPAGRLSAIDFGPGVDPPAGAPRTGLAAPADLAAALDLLVLEVPEPEGAVMVQDPDTLQEAAVITYQDKNDKPVYELYYLADPTDPTAPGAAAAPQAPRAPEAGSAAAVAAPNTVFRRLSEEGEERTEIPLGGRLPFYEARRVLLCTAQVRQGQMALNLALTMIPRNVTSSGFLSDTLLSAQMPGEWEYQGGQRKRFVPQPYKRGPGIATFVSPLSYKDETGKTVVTTPSIDHSPPQSPEPSQLAARGHYRDILEEMDQVHILLGAEADPSGRSREEARTDYVASLDLTAGSVNPAGRWLLEAVVAYGEAIMGQPGLYTSQLRAEFECRINAGVPTEPARQQNDAEWDAGRLSTATAMERNGVVDVEAEQQRIESDSRAQTIIGGIEGEKMAALTLAGLSLVDAGEWLRLPEWKMKILRRAQAVQEEAARRAAEAFARGTGEGTDTGEGGDGGDSAVPSANGGPPGAAEAPESAPGTGAAGARGAASGARS